MSTKNLARTVIEGGRARFNQFQRRHSNGVHRVKSRRFCLALLSGDDTEQARAPERHWVGRSFHDKLGPALHWLESQVGRPWNKVRSELFARFDTRTTAGRHILFDHLLDEVESAYKSPFARFQLDRHGILRGSRFYSRKWLYRSRTVPRLPEPESVVLGWLAERRVVQHGEQLFWLLPTPSGAFRQGTRLAIAEAARWSSLPEWFRIMHAGIPARAEQLP